jgi:hypothetical protein
MTLRVVFRPEARHEVLDAYLWYEAEQCGLGERFKADLSECLDYIQSAPPWFSD